MSKKHLKRFTVIRPGDFSLNSFHLYEKDFKKVFFALNAQTGCPALASRKYYYLIIKRLFSEGAGFLKILAALPILGLRVLGKDIPKTHEYRLKVRSSTSFPHIFAWHFRTLESLSQKAHPTPDDVLLVRRILTLFSIAKMLCITSDGRVNRERKLYAQRSTKSVDKDRADRLYMLIAHDVEEFLNVHGYIAPKYGRIQEAVPLVGNVFMDTCCYSLKSLAKKANQKFRQLLPRAFVRHLMRLDPNDLPYVCSPEDFDGKQMVIVETGGKYRGITPYYSPLVHSSSVYRSMRTLLSGWKPDVSLDQKVGHERCRLLTTLGETVVSADASAFTDSIDLDMAHVLLRTMGQDGFLDYLGDLRLSTINGPINTSLPLMGLKGCYELGCVLLAYSVWRQAKLGGLRLKGMAHACDDLVGIGTRDSFSDAYSHIGCKLNTAKTVVSKTTAVFCGKLFWLGHDVSPVKINLTRLVETTSSEVLEQMMVSFWEQSSPVWGRYARKQIEKLTKRAIYRCYKTYDDRFRLPGKLGGFSISRKRNMTLLKLLENKFVLSYALRHTPIEEPRPDVLTSMLAYVRLGEPARMPDGKILPSVTLPTAVGRRKVRKRRKAIDQLIKSGRITSTDAILYLYGMENDMYFGT